MTYVTFDLIISIASASTMFLIMVVLFVSKPIGLSLSFNANPPTSIGNEGNLILIFLTKFLVV